VRADQIVLINSLVDENAILTGANMTLFQQKDTLQKELLIASQYIITLEENCAQANQNALSILKQLKETEEHMDTLR
jgi:hypothetical protein